jgi:molybdopterin-guanine dinucleotide biosynthesis protein A
MSETRAVLLAGGRSHRMGRDKPTLVLNGEPLVGRHVRQAALAGIDDLVVVANDDNEGAITAALAETPRHVRISVVRQELPNAEGAIVAGLEHVCDAHDVVISCTNDIVDDDTYGRLLRLPESPSCSLALVAARVSWPFVGGRLVEGDEPGSIQRIDERPPGGCPPGSAINVMIHRLAGQELWRAVLNGLRRGEAYETCLNSQIAAGTSATALAVTRWVGIKTTEDLERARAIFG